MFNFSLVPLGHSPTLGSSWA